VDLKTGRKEVIDYASFFLMAADRETVAYVYNEDGTVRLKIKKINDEYASQVADFRIEQKLSGLHWSPDSRYLACLLGERKENGPGTSRLQIHRKDFAQPLHDVEISARFTGVFAWDRSGTRAVFVLREWTRSPSENTDVQVISAEEYLPPDDQLWLFDLTTGELKKLHSGSYEIISMQWNHCGTHVYFSILHGLRYNTGNEHVNIHSCEIESGITKPLLEAWGGHLFKIGLCPNADKFAFFQNTTDVYYPEFRKLVVFEPESNTLTQLTEGLNVSRDLLWSTQGDKLYFKFKGRHFDQYAVVSEPGYYDTITPPDSDAVQLAVSPDGRLAWLSRNTSYDWCLNISDSDGLEVSTIATWQQRIDRSSLGDVENITWKSTDGLEIPGYLILPVNYQAGQRYPLIVDIHGGPVGGIRLSGSILCNSPLEWHMWAELGYVVLVPDYRTSILDWESYAQCREKQDYADWEFLDVMSGVNHIIKLGVADPDRMAVIGHSYGSTVTNIILTKTDRFRAAVSYEGFIGDDISWGSPARIGGNACDTWMYKGRPREVPQNYRRNTSACDLHRIKTPTLLVEGGKMIAHVGNRFHYFYSVLYSMGVPTELVIYKTEEHVVMKKRENQHDLVQRVIKWISRFLDDGQ